MNPEDLIKLASEIYAIDVGLRPQNWDKQKMAREAIESAKQFFLALQSEKEGISSLTYEELRFPQPVAPPTASTGQWTTQSSVELSKGPHTTVSNQMAAGRGKVTQRHSGQGMG